MVGCSLIIFPTGRVPLNFTEHNFFEIILFLLKTYTAGVLSGSNRLNFNDYEVTVSQKEKIIFPITVNGLGLPPLGPPAHSAVINLTQK